EAHGKDPAMSSRSLRRLVAALATICIFGLVFATLGPSQQEKGKQAKKKRAPKPGAMSASLVGLEMALGLADKKVTKWDGDVRISEGKILEVVVTHGNPKAKVEGTKFTVSSVSRKTDTKEFFEGPVLHVSVDAPLKAVVTVNTEQG